MTAVVFDMDGTLIDSAMIVPDAFILTLADLGVVITDRTQIIEKYSLGPPGQILSHFLRRPAELADVDAYHSNLSNSASGVRTFLGISEMLGALYKTVELAVFTGASRQAAEILLASVGIMKWFETVVGGDQVDHPKPHPAGLNLTFAALSAEPLDGFYVGDSPIDLEAAIRAGTRPIAAGWGHLYEAQDNVETASSPLDVMRLIETPW